jgi:glycosyltransferase involved in cell wall biosynthesis
VKRQLRQSYGREADVYVTFPPEEWAACDAGFRESVINVGVLSLSQCPSFYAQMDAVVFPSLLECFSAVPIETMKVGRPLFASDLSFIRDVCGDHCAYFDPLDAADIARSIDAFFSLPEQARQQRCDAARAHVARFPGPDARAAGYLHVIRQMMA